MNEGRSSPLIKSKTALIFPNGDVYNPRQRKLCKPAIKTLYGFKYYNNLIGLNGAQLPLHLVVADLFLPNPAKLKFVWFKDGNRKNCAVTNLY